MLQTVYEPNHLSILHWPDWYKQKLLDAFTLSIQRNSYMSFNNRAKKMMPAYRLCKRVCANSQTVYEDQSAAYLAVYF